MLASKIGVPMELLPLPVGNAAKEGDVHGVATWLYGGGGVDARCAERDDMTLVMAAAEGGQKAPSSSGALSGGGAVQAAREGGRV